MQHGHHYKNSSSKSDRKKSRKFRLFIKYDVNLDPSASNFLSKLQIMQKQRLLIYKASFSATNAAYTKPFSEKELPNYSKLVGLKNIFNVSGLHDTPDLLTHRILRLNKGSKYSRSFTISSKLSTSIHTKRVVYFKRIIEKLKRKSISWTFLGPVNVLLSPSFLKLMTSLQLLKLTGLHFTITRGDATPDLSPLLDSIKTQRLLKEFVLNANQDVFLNSLYLAKVLSQFPALRSLKIATYLAKGDPAQVKQFKELRSLKRLRYLHFEFRSHEQEVFKWLLRHSSLKSLELSVSHQFWTYSSELEEVLQEIRSQHNNKLRSLKLIFKDVIFTDPMRRVISDFLSSLRKLKGLYLNSESGAIMGLFCKVVYTLKSLESLEIICKGTKQDWETLFQTSDALKNLKTIVLHVNQAISLKSLSEWLQRLTRLKSIKVIFEQFQFINEKNLFELSDTLSYMRYLESINLDMRVLAVDEPREKKYSAKNSSPSILQPLKKLEELNSIIIYFPGQYLTTYSLNKMLNALEGCKNLKFFEFGGNFEKINQDGIRRIEDYIESNAAKRLLNLEIIPWRSQHLNNYRLVELLHQHKNSKKL